MNPYTNLNVNIQHKNANEVVGEPKGTTKSQQSTKKDIDFEETEDILPYFISSLTVSDSVAETEASKPATTMQTCVKLNHWIKTPLIPPRPLKQVNKPNKDISFEKRRNNPLLVDIFDDTDQDKHEFNKADSQKSEYTDNLKNFEEKPVNFEFERVEELSSTVHRPLKASDNVNKYDGKKQFDLVSNQPEMVTKMVEVIKKSSLPQGSTNNCSHRAPKICRKFLTYIQSIVKSNVDKAPFVSKYSDPDNSATSSAVTAEIIDKPKVFCNKSRFDFKANTTSSWRHKRPGNISQAFKSDTKNNVYNRRPDSNFGIKPAPGDTKAWNADIPDESALTRPTAVSQTVTSSLKKKAIEEKGILNEDQCFSTVVRPNS